MFGKKPLLVIGVVFGLLMSFGSVGAQSLPFEAPDPTHEIVCECDCGGEIQTYEWIPNHKCSRFDGIPCDYDDGSTSKLSGCVKKAQKITDPTPVDDAVDEKAAQVPVDPDLLLETFDPPLDQVAFAAWLDETSQMLFNDDFPGLYLDESPNTAGFRYLGDTALNPQAYTLDVTHVYETETIKGYVDRASSEVFDLEMVWLDGVITGSAGSLKTGALAATAIYVNDPTVRMTTLLPLGDNFPQDGQGDIWQGVTGGGRNTLFSTFDSKLDAFAGRLVATTEDACDGCKNTANKAIKRMKKSLKRCLFWRGGAATVVGGAVGLLGGNPGTVIAGGIAGAGIASGYCADKALAKYGEIIEDFCECLNENDCPPHSKCTEPAP